MSQRLYTIKEVSMRSGLSTQLIRKWEARYEAVSPARFPNGYRGYTKQDVETLLWLKRRVDEGVPIGLAVEEWKGLPSSPLVRGVVQPEAAGLPLPGEASEYREMLLQLFLHLDSEGAQRFLDRLLSLHPVDFVLLGVLAPSLVEIGEKWERGEISEYQEHFSSHFVRDRLLSLIKLDQQRSEAAPLVVTACSPGERHELGVLFSGYFLVQEGFRTVYLGAAPSEKGLLDCLEQLKPAALAFGASSQQVFNEAEPFYRELDRRIAEGKLATKVFLGGRIVQEDRLQEGTRAVFLLSGDAREAVRKMKQLIQ